MALGRKGGEVVVWGGSGEEREKEGDDFSSSKIEARESGKSQGGGRMEARRWRLRRRASQRGRGVR